MAIYEYRGIETGRICEWIGKYDEKPNMLYDPETEEEYRPIISRPSLLNSNLSDWQRGLSGASSYDRNLKQVIYSEKHRDEVLASKGLVRESDLPANYIEDKVSENERITKKLDDESDVFFKRMEKYGLDKQGDNTPERVKATERFWSEQVPAGAVRQDPKKYGITKE